MTTKEATHASIALVLGVTAIVFAGSCVKACITSLPHDEAPPTRAVECARSCPQGIRSMTLGDWGSLTCECAFSEGGATMVRAQ